MKFLKTGPASAPYALRALTMVARAASNGLGKPQLAMLDAMQQLVLETSLDLDTLPTVTAKQLASQFSDAAQARQLIRLMVAISVADGSPSMDQMSLLTSFAAKLGVQEHSVSVIRHLAKKRLLLFRMSFARRSHVRSYFKNSYRLLGGVVPVVKAILRFRGLIREDKDLSARFYAFEQLPEDTLGYCFFKHCKERGLPFAGEKGGFPIGAVFHDFGHVLAGYDTDPEGEMKNAAFQSGYLKADEDDFFTWLFAMIIHTAGVNLAPFAMPVLLGRVGQGNLALEMLHGWQRGAAMNVDLASDWDFWQHVALPIDVVRERLGVPPLNPSLLAA